ncbi:MAG: hypothetical protein M5U34_07340 [Chloroflexi bacterium]|nr:hypothetical protein [Chloroflexota bacterium]
MTVATPSPLPLDSRAKTPPWMVAWGYFQHELLYLTWLLMEAALLTPLLVLLVRWIRLWPAALLLLWLLLLMALSLNLARLMGLLTISLSRQRAVMVVTFLFVYLLTIRNLFYQPASLLDLAWLGQFGRNLADFSNINWLRDSGWFFLVLFLWWRGLRLAGKTFSVHHAGIRLRVGGLILAPLLIVWSSNHLPWRVFPFYFALLFSGVNGRCPGPRRRNRKSAVGTLGAAASALAVGGFFGGNRGGGNGRFPHPGRHRPHLPAAYRLVGPGLAGRHQRWGSGSHYRPGTPQPFAQFALRRHTPVGPTIGVANEPIWRRCHPVHASTRLLCFHA